MLKVRKIQELKGILSTLRTEYSSLGLVPTMGALHEGHFVLLERCKAENDFTMATIFVNPLQFNDPNDYANYPATLNDDLDELERRGCDLVFYPPKEEIYPEDPLVTIQFGDMEKVLEGQYRPGHFRGVGVVLTKLFHLLSPNRAYFGLKDLQQYLLIRRLVRDLSFDVEVVGVPTVREEGGLALSSRNLRLSESGKIIARKLAVGLLGTENRITAKHPPNDIVNGLREFYSTIDGLEIEYVEMVNARDLKPFRTYDEIDEVALCVAAYVEEVRLIDNLYLHLDTAK